ncbi:TPA: hypothetical protein PRV43_004420 [Escherichia coli]|jgi:glutathione peroxidase-family protein|nr:hypothetical protein [Escherichia coli]HDW2473114.1 hypothetical protein [Escherichia coli]
MNAAAVTMATLSQKELFSGGLAWNFRLFIIVQEKQICRSYERKKTDW